MTTKKQRRQQVAEKRAAFDAETKRLGLEAQRRDRERREQIKFEAERAERSKKEALKMRKVHEAKATTPADQDAAREFTIWAGRPTEGAIL